MQNFPYSIIKHFSLQPRQSSCKVEGY
jgi:hypothetical protein